MSRDNKKQVKTYDEAWNIQEKYEYLPHGWIQWKGTYICVDIHCSCGKISHYDGDFFYYVRCPHCKKIYFCNGHIELIETEEPDCDFKNAEP